MKSEGSWKGPVGGADPEAEVSYLDRDSPLTDWVTGWMMLV